MNDTTASLICGPSCGMRSLCRAGSTFSRHLSGSCKAHTMFVELLPMTGNCFTHVNGLRGLSHGPLPPHVASVRVSLSLRSQVQISITQPFQRHANAIGSKHRSMLLSMLVHPGTHIIPEATYIVYGPLQTVNYVQLIHVLTILLCPSESRSVLYFPLILYPLSTPNLPLGSNS